MKIAILGAGLTGLELGRRLKELEKDFTIFEKGPQIGGLCQTNKTGDYYWDIAVHAIYSRNQEAMHYFLSLPLDYQYSNRNAKIMHYGRNNKQFLIDYPFENGARGLPLKEKLECILGYIAARIKKNEFHNLEEWINSRLGFGIARHFMVPYNNKIWNCKLSSISEYLVSSKIEPASAIEFIKNTLWKKTVGREYQSKFFYPRKGIQALCDYIAKDIRNNVLLKANVDKLSRQSDKWVINLSNGRVAEVDMVVSTIPLVELLKKIDICGVEKEYDELKWNNTFSIMVGLRKGCRFGLINDCHWVFLKGDEIFYRITLMHNFSNEFLPALVAEVTEKGDILNMSNEEIEEIVIKDLLRLGIIESEDDIAVKDLKRIEYTYPIPTVGLVDIKNKIRTILQTHNLFLLGRSGNWDYLNMDGVFLKVKEFVQKI